MPCAVDICNTLYFSLFFISFNFVCLQYHVSMFNNFLSIIIYFQLFFFQHSWIFSSLLFIVCLNSSECVSSSAKFTFMRFHFFFNFSCFRTAKIMKLFFFYQVHTVCLFLVNNYAIINFFFLIKTTSRHESSKWKIE